MTTTLLVGDALEVLQTLDDGSVQCCVTSPPYYGLRDYGVPGQIGLERTPDEYVAKLVAVFADVRRVLADDGTLWLNLGDSYAGRGRTGGMNSLTLPRSAIGESGWVPPAPGFKDKDLYGIPWRVAFALQADGWYLRSDIIWHKPNPMPESVTDRPTKAHEYLFLLSKSERYFYDAAAIAEPAACGGILDGGDYASPGQAPHANARASVARGGFAGKTEAMAGEGRNAFRAIVDTRNRRTVWTVATQPFSEAHFATFPPALIEPCILAGSRVGDTILDPFGGAGTTALVADRLSRSALLIELNPAYAEMARRRISDDAGMFAEFGVGSPPSGAPTK